MSQSQPRSRSRAARTERKAAYAARVACGALGIPAGDAPAWRDSLAREAALTASAAACTDIAAALSGVDPESATDTAADAIESACEAAAERRLRRAAWPCPDPLPHRRRIATVAHGGYSSIGDDGRTRRYAVKASVAVDSRGPGLPRSPASTEVGHGPGYVAARNRSLAADAARAAAASGGYRRGVDPTVEWRKKP